MRSAPATTISARGTGPGRPLRRARGRVERALRGVTWRALVGVVAFCVLYGVGVGDGAPTHGAPHRWADVLAGPVAALTLFLPTYALAALTAPFAPRNTVLRAIVLTLAVTAGVALGYGLSAIVQEAVVSWRGGGARHATAVLPVLVTAWAGVAILLLQERERAAAQALHDEAERKLDVERRMSEARLRVLQSQIEPHFLFNSLAHVRRLCRTNLPAGRTMLRHLAHYLGAAQPALQHAFVPLAADVELAVAYLNIQQIRMRERLSFSVDLAPEARDARVPPLTVTTLVENAIKHGLSPLARGGTIGIVARLRNGNVVVEVADDGRGFQSTLGAGVGLANTQARLAMLHGDAASLALSMNVPQGVVATVKLPRAPRGTAAP